MTPVMRPREIKFLRELREKSLNPIKMETNELPEGWHPDTSKIYISPSKDSIYNFVDGEWKLYRLALQSKEEEIAKDKKALNWQAQTIQEQIKTIEELEEQLKAKDEEIARLKKWATRLLEKYPTEDRL